MPSSHTLTRALLVFCCRLPHLLCLTPPVGWAPPISITGVPRFYFAQTRVATTKQCNTRAPEGWFNPALEWCLSVNDKAAFCGGDSGSAMYTIGKSGGKATAFIHGIYIVR